MFSLRKSADPTLIDVEIARLHANLADNDQPHSKEYAATVDQLLKLSKHKEEVNSKRKVSPDALVTAGASILGILIIVGHEHAHVITTKAIGFVTKAR